MVALATIGGSTLAIERAGTATGWPFGRYRYSGALRPVVAGVPAVVPLAWFAMAVPAREVAHAVLGSRSRPATRAVVAAGALVAWDLFLDPQMTAEGYWLWARAGRYRGIPASNFVGWLATGAVLTAALDGVLPPDEPDAALVGQYAAVAAFSALGFAVFFGDPLVALVGGAAMLPLAAGAVVRLARARVVTGVVVAGGGVGGLCVAIRLAVAGHPVTVLEQAAELGGKLGTRQRDGFHFDTGPSLLTLPHVFDEVLALTGTTLAAEVDLVRLQPQFRYHWPDGTDLTVHDDGAATAAAFDAIAPGGGAAWRAFDARGRRIWDVAERTFFAGPMGSPLALARRLERPSDLVAIDARRTLAAAATRAFGGERHLVQWACRYATYSGSSPYAAPATLACIPHIEARYGAWYVRGGLGALRDALVRAASRADVVLRTGADVVGIDTGADGVTGVRLAEGERVAAGVVVANVDAEHLYTDLLPDDAALRRVRRAEPSTSGFAVLAGVAGTTAGLAHHNVWFSTDGRREFAQLFDQRQPPDDPTIYACVSSVTDPSQAPPGDENWFLLVNAPAGAEIDADRYRDRILAVLAGRGVDLRRRLRFTETITPADMARRFRASGGAIYGTSSNGRRAAFLRPGNRGPRRGLYLVGGSSHPGGGLPLVATSARIVADLVAADGW